MILDDSDFQKGLKVIEDQIIIKTVEGRRRTAEHLLTLSQQEVPLDEGTLQNSGNTQHDADESIVGYHTAYAARLHENPQYKFKNNRKGKYLEDPLKMNLHIFLKVFGGSIEKAFTGAKK